MFYYMIVSHCATGRGRAVRLWGGALCDGYLSQCATLLLELSTFSQTSESVISMAIRGEKAHKAAKSGSAAVGWKGEAVSPESEVVKSENEAVKCDGLPRTCQYVV